MHTHRCTFSNAFRSARTSSYNIPSFQRKNHNSKQVPDRGSPITKNNNNRNPRIVMNNRQKKTRSCKSQARRAVSDFSRSLSTAVRAYSRFCESRYLVGTQQRHSRFRGFHMRLILLGSVLYWGWVIGVLYFWMGRVWTLGRSFRSMSIWQKARALFFNDAMKRYYLGLRN